MSTTFRAVRPLSTEFAEYYAKYIARVPDGDIVVTLKNQIADMKRLLLGLTDTQAMFVYAPGKWNVKEVVGHLIDGERVFAYRALRIARGDSTPLPGFDENAYAKTGGYAGRSMQDIADEFEHVRVATLDLLSHLDEVAWLRLGTANGYPASTRALAWDIAGHELHHRAILHERYLI